MKACDREAFQELLTAALAFYHQDVTEFALSVWWQACERFDIEQVRKALTAHALDPDRGQYPPKPADLIRKLEGTSTDRSLLAWSAVLSAARSVGAYRSVAFDDPAIHAAIVDIGGWQSVCRSSTDEMPFLQKRFTDYYRAHVARGGPTDAPQYLAGDSELGNAIDGRSIDPPVRISTRPDKQQARLVSPS